MLRTLFLKHRHSRLQRFRVQRQTCTIWLNRPKSCNHQNGRGSSLLCRNRGTGQVFYSLQRENGPSPASFSFIFGLFQTNINTILQQINVKKCSSSIWHWDLNPRSSERESPPITARPGLPPIPLYYLRFLSF